jgi:hypothetical protein
MNVSISIRKEIDKNFCDFLNKNSFFTPHLGGNHFHRTFLPLIEIARVDIAMSLRREKILRKYK